MACDEWGSSQGKHANCNQSLEGPVIAAMSWRCFGHGCCVVDSPMNDLRAMRQNISPCAGVESCYSRSVRSSVKDGG